MQSMWMWELPHVVGLTKAHEGVLTPRQNETTCMLFSPSPTFKARTLQVFVLPYLAHMVGFYDVAVHGDL